MNETYFYAIIEKETGCCVQTLKTACKDFNVDDEYAYSVPIQLGTIGYLDKYYFDEVWYQRIWNMLDDNNNPIESAGYVDKEWEIETE